MNIAIFTIIMPFIRRNFILYGLSNLSPEIRQKKMFNDDAETDYMLLLVLGYTYIVREKQKNVNKISQQRKR